MANQQEQVENIISNSADIGHGDKAADILAELFGGEWWKILWSGQDIQGDPSLIIPLLEVLNSVTLAAVALVLIYVVAHAMIGSAHEGTPLGRRLHSIWVPVRAVFSITLLSPLPWCKSLCVIQGIVLSFVGMSIELANLTMYAGIDYMAKNGGQVVASAPNNLDSAGVDVAKVALNNYAIQYHQFYFQQEDDLYNGYTKTKSEPFLQKAKSYFGVQGMTNIYYDFRAPENYNDGTMGRITLKCKDPDAFLCQARQVALEDLLAYSENVAAEKIRKLNGLSHDIPSESETVRQIEAFGSTIKDAVQIEISAEDTELNQEIEAFTDAIKDQGFALLGTYFWTMSRFSTALNEQVHANITTEDYNKDLLDDQTIYRFNQIDVNMHAMNAYFGRTQRMQDVASMGYGSIDREYTTEDNGWGKISAATSNFFLSGVDGFMKAITSGNPIANLAGWGHNIMNSIMVATPVLIGLSLVPIVGKLAMPVLLLVFPPMFLLGLVLAYYLPAIPFIFWIVGLFSWVLMVIEAMVAAPIWAAMHANPDGEGLAGNKAGTGYNIFFQVLLRPALMVAGFFFALLLIHVIPHFGELFSGFFRGLSANETLAGPITAAAGMVMGSILIVMLCQKAFKMIYLLPEGLAKWMGSQSLQAGGEQEVDSTKAVFVGGVASRTTQDTTQMIQAGKQAVDQGKQEAGGAAKTAAGFATGGAGGAIGAAASDHATGEVPDNSGSET